MVFPQKLSKYISIKNEITITNNKKTLNQVFPIENVVIFINIFISHVKCSSLDQVISMTLQCSKNSYFSKELALVQRHNIYP